MDPAALAARIEAQGERATGSDAERRAAALCAAQLRAGNRRPRTQTLWVRRHRAPAGMAYAALGAAGSVVAVSDAAVGLGLAAGALAAALLEAAGVPLLTLLQVRRATQNVIAPPPDGRNGRALLVVVAPAHGSPRSLLRALAGVRWIPGPTALLVLGLAGVAAGAGARLGGAEGTTVGIAQLVPSVLLLIVAALLADDALAAREPSGAGPAVAVAVAGALDAQPPRALAAEVVITGDLRDYVRARRHEVAPEEVVVIELLSAPGPVRYLVSDGELLPMRLHPRLIELASALPGAAPRRGRGRSGARVARGARWPAIALEGDPRPLAAAALRLIASVDRELLQARGR